MPATHSLTRRGQEAVDKIRAESQGRIDIQIFPDNQLGGDNDMTAQVRAGALEIYTAAATSVAPLAQTEQCCCWVCRRRIIFGSKEIDSCPLSDVPRMTKRPRKKRG